MVRQELNITIAHNEDVIHDMTVIGKEGGTSKPNGTAKTTAKTPSGRTPNCARCKNHNKSVLLRGHKRYCPYVECVCDKCKLIARRQVVMAKQVALRRAQALDEAMGRTVIEEVDPEELKQAAENGSMPPADCVTVADMAMPSLPSSPYSPSPSSSSSSSTSYPPSHPLFGPGGPSSLYAAGDGSPPLFMSLPFPLPPSPHRPYEPWPRSDVAPFLASMSGGVPPPPPLTQRPTLPRPIPTAGVHVPPLTRYDGMAGDVAVTAASNAAAVAAAASTYVSSVYAYERGSAGMPPHMEHHPGIPLPSYGPSLIWWD